MSSIGYDRPSVLSAGEQQPNIAQQQDDAQFFSVAQQYNERKAKMINHRAMQAMNMIHNFNIKNNPKDPKALNQNKQEKTRKTRNDKQGRQYTCGGCKLSYLSYPALYTHIKTKHGGVAPQGTIRGKNNNNKRRGRPKNLRAQPNLHHRPQPQFIFPKQYTKLVQQINFIDMDDQQKQQDQQNENGEQPQKLQTQFFNNQIRQLKNTNSPLITLPITKILTIYLYNINQLLHQKKQKSQATSTMQTIEQISEKLISFINKNYFKILSQFQINSAYFIRKQIPQTQIYCEYQKCDYVPVFVSWFFRRMDKDNDQLEVDFLVDFCQWLYKKSLSYVRLMKPEVLEAGVGISQE